VVQAPRPLVLPGRGGRRLPLGLLWLLGLGVGPGCSDQVDETRLLGLLQLPLTAYCTAQVVGIGGVPTETDYLPHVVNCENGGAGFEALKAQAVAARSFLYYKMASAGSIRDGQSDQVYSCGREPGDQHRRAVEETSGQFLSYRNTLLCAFYVAGAIPSTEDCVAAAGDRDPTGTEGWVTYNWGRSGSDVIQTRLGWVNAGNYANRGCQSQNGANCLSQRGRGYVDILHFYYGMDIELQTAEGACVGEPDCRGDEDCADGDVCNGGERCVGGTCQAGAPLDCRDEEDCTTDGCDRAAGCRFAPVGDGTPCGGGGSCRGGVCQPPAPDSGVDPDSGTDPDLGLADGGGGGADVHPADSGTAHDLGGEDAGAGRDAGPGGPARRSELIRGAGCRLVATSAPTPASAVGSLLLGLLLGWGWRRRAGPG